MNVNVERLREIAVAIAERRWGELNMRIPADESRDADLVVAAAAREIQTLRAELDTAIRRAEAAEVVMLNRTWVAPPMSGWLCPRCGRGNAPMTETCPCGPAIAVTCGSATA